MLLRLARLHLGVLSDAGKAEGFLREALRRDRSLAEAETLLAELLERDGRLAELAAWYEECAARRDGRGTPRRCCCGAPPRCTASGRGVPEAAAAALLAARAAAPDDLELTAQAAELLHEVGRAEDAAEFDAILLEADPFREPIFTRHRAFLEETADHQALADADAAPGPAPAARRGRRELPRSPRRPSATAGAQERALLCEDRAFELDPSNAEAFELLRERLPETCAGWRSCWPSARPPCRPRRRCRCCASAPTACWRPVRSLLAAEAFDEYLARAGDDVDALSARAELAAQGGGPIAAQPV